MYLKRTENDMLLLIGLIILIGGLFGGRAIGWLALVVSLFFVYTAITSVVNGDGLMVFLIFVIVICLCLALAGAMFENFKD